MPRRPTIASRVATYELVEFPSPASGPAPNPWSGSAGSAGNLRFLEALLHVFQHVNARSPGLSWRLKTAEALVVRSLIDIRSALRQNQRTFRNASLRHRQLALESIGLAMLTLAGFDRPQLQEGVAQTSASTCT